MKRLLHALAHPALFFYTLPWLMALLVLGTVAQREIGLYQAERLYFSNPVFWLGPLPLPGTSALLALVVLNIAAKLLTQKWPRRKLGTAITHLSILLLLLGGGITALLREEGFMELSPAAIGGSVTDYYARELMIRKNGAAFAQIPFGDLAADMPVPSAGLPFTLRLHDICRHCEAVPQTAADNRRRGAARQMALKPAPLLPQDENNLAGVTLEIGGLDAERNGIYVSYAPLKEIPAVIIGNDRYELIIQRVQRPLPFQIRLEAFHKSEHPGTRLARDYRSDVTVIDGTASWPTTIAMNEPLRYRGYTFYQSSFAERPGQPIATVLTVVRDQGQIFPYLAIAAMCLGMGFHLVLRQPHRRRQAA